MDMSRSPELSPEFLEPCLRIFISVDIVGSTNFKQLLASKVSDEKNASNGDAATHPGRKWLNPILQFYDQMAARFGHEWRSLSEAAKMECAWIPGEAPQLWKAVGDELIFTKKLGSHHEAYICVAAMLKTVHGFRNTIKAHSSGLDLKCAAWIAGFPVNNAEVVLSTTSVQDSLGYDDGDFIFANLTRLHDMGKDPTAIRDYIGPSVDTGFRVASLSNPRQFVLTVDLALLLAAASSSTPAAAQSVAPLTYYYLGRIPLKGVTNDVPYPVFWIDAATPSSLTAIEDRLEGRQPVNAALVREYCERYIERQQGTHIIRPYLINDSDHAFRQKPADHTAKLVALNQYWELEQRKRQVEVRAAIEDPRGSLKSDIDADTPDEATESVGKVLATLRQIQGPRGPLAEAIRKFVEANRGSSHDGTAGLVAILASKDRPEPAP